MMKHYLKQRTHFSQNKQILYSLSIMLFFVFNVPLMVEAQVDNKALQNSNFIKPSTQVLKQFNPIDGSHIKFRQYIENELLHKDSFIHAGTAYSKRGGVINITMTYRAKNKFNMLINHSANADYSTKGNLIKVYKIE